MLGLWTRKGSGRGGRGYHFNDLAADNVFDDTGGFGRGLARLTTNEHHGLDLRPVFVFVAGRHGGRLWMVIGVLC